MQDRTLLHDGAGLSVERVRSHPGPTEWSRAYATQTQRFVLPMSGTALDFRANDQTWLVDGLTAMCLGRDLAYQLRPGRSLARESLVVSGKQTDASDAEPRFWLLCPRTLLRVRLASRGGEQGTAVADMAGALITEVLHGKRQLPSRGAVARARRLLVTAPDTFARATIHEIAEAAAISGYHLARSFRRQTGLSLNQYRQRLRLAAVLDRLSDGERDLPGLAHDHGFCSQSHLGAVFQREVGVTLGQARTALASRP